MKKLMVLLANGFGTGLSPVASGTVGSLLGLPLAWLFCRHLPVWGQIGAGLALTGLAVVVADVAEKHYGKKDDGRIVVDEYLLFPLCMIGLPATPLMLAVAFFFARACDVIKPPPARGLQRLTGGVGIVIDDFIASLYALALNHAAYWIMVRYELM